MSETLREQLERQLAEPLQYVSQEARYFVLDALACHMHNKGYFIQGCTEENDARWFARAMWTEFHGEVVSAGDFDNQGTEEQEVWIKTARCAISLLPSLMSRVANRAIHYSQALREMERTSRIELKELSSSVCPVPSFLRDSTLKHATRCRRRLKKSHDIPDRNRRHGDVCVCRPAHPEIARRLAVASSRSLRRRVLRHEIPK